MHVGIVGEEGQGVSNYRLHVDWRIWDMAYLAR